MSKWSKRKKRTDKVYWTIDQDTGNLLTHIHIRYYGGIYPRGDTPQRYKAERTYRQGDYVIIEMKKL